MSATMSAIGALLAVTLACVHAQVGRPCGTRTHNQRIKSPELCQLS